MQPHRPGGGPTASSGTSRLPSWGRSTVVQVTLLTQYIEDSFQYNEKAGVVFLGLTAAYDTVWHRGLHLKRFRTIPDRHMVGFSMMMLSNRSS